MTSPNPNFGSVFKVLMVCTTVLCCSLVFLAVLDQRVDQLIRYNSFRRAYEAELNCRATTRSDLYCGTMPTISDFLK